MSLKNFFQQTDPDGKNNLHLTSGDWLINEVPVTATAEQINNSGALTPTSGVHVTSWSGIWAASQAGSISFQKVGRIVTLNLPVISSAANTAAAIASTIVLPAILRPSETFLYAPAIILTNSVATAGLIKINSSGTINLFASVAEGNFAATGNGGFFATSITYLAAP